MVKADDVGNANGPCPGGNGTDELLWFPELAQHSVDGIERGINLFSDLLVAEKKKVSADVDIHSTGIQCQVTLAH